MNQSLENFSKLLNFLEETGKAAMVYDNLTKDKNIAIGAICPNCGEALYETENYIEAACPICHYGILTVIED